MAASLLEQLQQLTDPTPLKDDDYDHDDVTAAKVVDKSGLLEDEEDVYERGAIGMRFGGRILAEEDDRYRGVLASRSAYEDEMDSSDDVIECSEEGNSEEGKSQSDQGVDERVSSDEEDSGSDGLVKLFSKVGTGDEKAKGRAVRDQIKLWEQLLGARIRFHRILSLTNRLPQTEDQWRAVRNETEEGRNEACRLLKASLDDLIKVQDELLRRDDALGEGRKKDDDEEIVSSPDEDEDERAAQTDKVTESRKRRIHDLDGYSVFLADREAALKAFRDDSVVKWFEKTRLATGRFAKSSFSAFEKNALQQIEHILSDRDRLIRRTQLKRSTYSILGKSAEGEAVTKEEEDQEYDEEIFDDDDFYQQLLRELIDRRTAGVTDPVLLSRQWLEMQKLRSKAKKKRVDRRASKGRKCRYDVIPKLVNFMAPIDRCPMTDQARDELFNSLFKSTS